MKKILLILLVIICMFFGTIVDATPGRLTSSSIKTCNGVTYGKHKDHWHRASKSGKYWYAEGSAMYTDPCKKTTSSSSKKTTEKSSVKTLSKLTVDDENISISDSMSIKTSNKNPNIVATATSDKASIKIDKPNELVYGNNKVTITVTAENNTTKKYTLNIYLISADNTIKSIKIDNEEIEISTKIEFKTVNLNPSIEVVTNSDKANFEIKKEELVFGNNEIKIIVTAENNEEKEYLINLYVYNNDATLNKIIIDNNEVELDDQIEYTTNKNVVDITAITNDENATISYSQKNELELGENEIKISVLAEDKITEKIYILNVIREEVKEVDNNLDDNNKSMETNISKVAQNNNATTIILIGSSIAGIALGINKFKKKKA